MLFLPITLDCLPVKSFHNSTANFRVHASVNFLKMVLQVCDGFAGVRSIDSAMLSLQHEKFLTNGTRIVMIYSACSFMDAMFSLGNFREAFFCFMSFVHAEHFQWQIWIFLSLHMCTVSESGFGKFWHKSFGYSLEKSERPCLFVVVFS